MTDPKTIRLNPEKLFPMKVTLVFVEGPIARPLKPLEVKKAIQEVAQEAAEEMKRRVRGELYKQAILQGWNPEAKK